MRNRIWTEMTQAKHDAEFAALYSEQQRRRLRYFNISILIFSSGGIMGLKLWDKLPLVACAIITFVSLLRLIQPHIIMSDKLILNLDVIHKFYIDYYNKLEKLWYDFEDGRIDLAKTTEIFFEVKQTESEINAVINETIRTKPQKLIRFAKKYSDNYFTQTFNSNFHG